MPHKIPFRVVHVSGQDESHKAVELNTHSPGTKGWQSARFCLYPQDLVILMERRSRLRKIQILSHQFLIATKIEFYIGDMTPGGQPSMQDATYTRLGYVALSDNEKTNYHARELKSVHVDAVGVFLKLVIHKNYVSKHNLYNQVGIIALNVIGDDVISPYEMASMPMEEYEQRLASVDKPYYISPLEDLAFDIYQDPEIAEIIRKMEKRKQTAVAEERFDYARRLRDAVNSLQAVGEKLGRLEIEKKQAIEVEDYERAHLKKLQIDDYRSQAYREMDVERLLSDRDWDAPLQPSVGDYRPLRPQLHSEASHPSTGTPAASQAPPPVIRVSPKVRGDPYQDPEERPLPTTQKNKVEPRVQPTPQPEPAAPSRRAGASSRVAQEVAPYDDEGVEEMSEVDRREAASAIDVFGMGLVSRAYSKSWSHRENALLDVYKRLSEIPADMDMEDKKAELRAAVFLVHRGIKDKVFAVFRAALNLNKFLLVDYAEQHQIPRADLHYAVDKVVPSLLSRTGETATRLRELAKSYTVQMSEWQNVYNFPSFYQQCLKHLPTNAMDRYALSRIELVADLYAAHGLGHRDFDLEAIMGFSAQALQHKHQEVRDTAEMLIVELYRNHDRGVIRGALPPDDFSTRKNPLYRRLFEKFDLLDAQGAPPAGPTSSRQPGATPREKRAAPTPKPAEPASSKAPTSQPATRRANPPPPQNQNNNNNNTDAGDLADDEDHLCIFCGEENPEFTKKGLDAHYWKSCPVLTRCPHCAIVVETCNYTQHLLTECPEKARYKQHPRCMEAVPVEAYAAHDREQTCNPVADNDPEGQAHCPLCHENIDVSQHEDNLDQAWRAHLMGTNGELGCSRNPRRIAKTYAQQQQQQQQQNGSTLNKTQTRPAGAAQPSQLPKPVNPPRKTAAAAPARK